MAIKVSKQSAYFPVFLRTDGVKALVVGGGPVALRKCRDLAAAAAAVRVVAPAFCAGFNRLSSVRLIRRRFRPADVRGAALVVAATDSEETNERVARAARKCGILVNVVDNPQESTFIVPAVLRQGKVVVAVSTGGASPALARNLRDRINRLIGTRAGKQAAFLSRIRKQVKEEIGDQKRRREIFERLAADDVGKMLASGDRARPRAMLREMLSKTRRPGE